MMVGTFFLGFIAGCTMMTVITVLALDGEE